MAARASDRDSRLIDLTKMTLEDIAKLDVALIDEAVGEFLARCGTTSRLWACQVRAAGQTSDSYPARA